MLTEEQLEKASALFSAACSYNAALHAAFVSEDDMVEVDLMVGDKTERVSVPTYHYLLKTVNKLANMVSQLQVSDDGSDVVQLLSTANNLTLLYLQKQQYYVQPPLNAQLIKYDYETVPTPYSAVNRTSLFIDLTNCNLPMDAVYMLAAFDDDQPMQLPIQYKTTSFDKVANVLSVTGEGSTAVYMLDSNDLTTGMKVQCNSNVYTVTSVSGQSVQLSSDQLSVTRQITAGDVIYTITDNAVAMLEVPVTKLASTLTLQVQYMKLVSAKATYDVSDMANAIHQTLRIPLSDCIKNVTASQVSQITGTALQAVPSNLAEIIANSTPVVTKTTVRQTNTHQYVHSTIETMVKTNAILVQARQDIQNLEQLINQLTEQIVAAGGDTSNNETLLTYNDQLASAKNRYQSAQASLSSMNVSAQAIRPEYAATLYCEPNDSEDAPLVQYIARYQYLSFGVEDVKNDWYYAYSDKRTINQDGTLSHPIDDYDILNSIQLPIHAYEQLVVQLSAVLQYGQPLMQVQTGWTNNIFITIPDNLLKETSIDEMFKNAYEAKLYTNVQQAMEAAGVYRHINPNVTYAHRAQDIQYDNNDTVYTKLQQMLRDIEALQTTAATPSLNVYVEYNSQYYAVNNGSQIVLNATQSYYAKCFEGLSGAELQEALGTVVEERFNIVIVNETSQTVYLNTMIPGVATDTLTDATWNQYIDLPLITKSTDNAGNVNYVATKPTYAMALYRGKQNATGNRDITIVDVANWSNISNGFASNINNALYDGTILGTCMPEQSGAHPDQQCAVIVSDIVSNNVYGLSRRIEQDYPGIGMHNDLPLYFIGGSGVCQVPHDDAELAGWQATADVCVAGHTLAMQAPYINGFNYDQATGVVAGSSRLAENYVQPALFDITDSNGTIFQPIVCFNPAVHKYTSGRASRGAFMFINPAQISALQLPAYGTSNATQIEPSTKETAAYIIPCTFQVRMSDRVGLNDQAPIVSKNGEYLQPADSGANFTYMKTINLSVKTGLSTISFDVTMAMTYFD